MSTPLNCGVLDGACAGCGAPLAPSEGRPRKWCSERCRKAQYSVPCEDCGAPVNGNDGRGAHRWCLECSGKRAGERQKDAWLEHRVMIEAMWADGLTSREIGAAIGYSPKHAPHLITKLRYLGYDLPHRRTPEQLERMGVGASERMAKARRIWAEMRTAA